jgi:hypothetical protein
MLLIISRQDVSANGQSNVRENQMWQTMKIFPLRTCFLQLQPSLSSESRRRGRS